MPDWLGGSMLINIGAACYILGFAVRDQLALRMLTLIGNGFYLGFYLFASPITLWGAIITTILMSVVNIYVMGQIALERTTWGMSAAERTLFERFATFTPGQFRRLLKLTEQRQIAASESLTSAGQPLDRLHYVADGEANATKGGQSFAIGAGNFIGEVAYVLGNPASAQVTARPGATILTWSSDALRAYCARKPEIGNALMALLGQDLAQKVADSVRLETT